MKNTTTKTKNTTTKAKKVAVETPKNNGFDFDSIKVVEVLEEKFKALQLPIGKVIDIKSCFDLKENESILVERLAFCSTDGAELTLSKNQIVDIGLTIYDFENFDLRLANKAIIHSLPSDEKNGKIMIERSIDTLVKGISERVKIIVVIAFGYVDKLTSINKAHRSFYGQLTDSQRASLKRKQELLIKEYRLSKNVAEDGDSDDNSEIDDYLSRLLND